MTRKLIKKQFTTAGQVKDFKRRHLLSTPELAMMLNVQTSTVDKMLTEGKRRNPGPSSVTLLRMVDAKIMKPEVAMVYASNYTPEQIRNTLERRMKKMKKERSSVFSKKYWDQVFALNPNLKL